MIANSPPAGDIARARILQGWIPELAAADPLELAKMVPEMLVAFKIAAVSRLRSGTPRPVLVSRDLTEEELA